MFHADDDLDTVAAAASRGDEEALAYLLQRVRPLILNHCRRKLAGAQYHFAEDVTQETCVALLSALDRYEDRGRFLPFLYRILGHKIADALRSAQRAPIPVGEVAEESCTSEGPEMHLLRQSSEESVNTLLQELPPRQREILRLRVLEQYTATETAAVLNSTAGAVRVAQHRALAKLRMSDTRLAA